MARKTKAEKLVEELLAPVPAKMAKELEKRNKKFDAMTKQQKAVAIAKDVKMQLAAGRIRAKSGFSYLSFDHHQYQNFRSSIGSAMYVATAQPVAVDSAQVVLERLPECTVCAVGSCFVSAVRLGNKIPLRTGTGSTFDSMAGYNSKSPLHNIFGESQMRLMEKAFECEPSDIPDFGEELKPFAKTKSDNKRLVMIMDNIIKNKGVFDPKKPVKSKNK